MLPNRRLTGGLDSEPYSTDLTGNYEFEMRIRSQELSLSVLSE